jgi:ABC-type histidine transport system ATPase subunit
MTQTVPEDPATSAVDPELVELIRAWPQLAETIRAAILLVVYHSR